MNKKTEIKEKLNTLKGIIRLLDKDLVGLLNTTAQAEISLRDTGNISDTEMIKIESQIDTLINKHKNPEGK
ncbi:MAG TPA: hypothetical protein PK605_02845 [Ignavibacteria bacterium]|nr:hypothetical protein [Bacteroidota bacterium]HRE11333.1 hypothetical protein [Ignavibacteria bacterium]HRF65647.1 hypothetical protein [Ignavibacteria bacterium]HRJ03321.1 hypothetical protein [Ignavibacteria bacterium]HRJ84553.1 hypothetical protein [Ignavibacteria bacterium]